MHSAPSVTYPVGRSRFAGIVLAGLWAAGALAAAAWSAQADAIGWRQQLSYASLAACGLFAALGWLRSPQGFLAWDGAGWWWSESALAAMPGRPHLVMDLQARLLLHWVGGDGARRWLWLERTSDAAHWDALRRAVYSPAALPVPPSGPSPSAEP